MSATGVVLAIDSAIMFFDANPSKWDTGAFARNEANESVAPTDPTACKFCALGAGAFMHNLESTTVSMPVGMMIEIFYGITFGERSSIERANDSAFTVEHAIANLRSLRVDYNENCG